MNTPSINTLEKKLDLDREIAIKIKNLISGKICVEDMGLESVTKKINECFNYLDNDYLVLTAINELIEGYGIESVKLGEGWTNEVNTDYINMGDSYANTIFLESNGRIKISCWAEYVEKNDPIKYSNS